MNKILCSGSPQRDHWAVGICFAAALMLILEALRPGGCTYWGMTVEQSFSASEVFASLLVFMGSFILMRALNRLAPKS